MKGFIYFVIHQVLLFLVSASIVARTTLSISFNVLRNDVMQKRRSRWGAKLSQTRSVDFIEIANDILRRYLFVIRPIVVNHKIVESCTSHEDKARS